MDINEGLSKILAQIAWDAGSIVEKLQHDPDGVDAWLSTVASTEVCDAIRQLLNDDLAVKAMCALAHNAAEQAIFNLMVFIDERRSVRDSDDRGVLDFAIDGVVIGPPDMSWHEQFTDQFGDVTDALGRIYYHE